MSAPKNLLFQKVAIFIDAENIEMSSLKHHEGRTDYKKLLAHVGDREIIRILYYKPIYKEISAEFENFWASLGGEIKRPNKNADTFLVIDAVTMAEKIDVAIIVGGDKDFLPLIWYMRSRGCKCEIWSWPETTSPEMKEAADYYQALTEEFVIQKGASSAGQKPPSSGGREGGSGGSRHGEGGGGSKPPVTGQQGGGNKSTPSQGNNNKPQAPSTGGRPPGGSGRAPKRR